MSDIKKDEHKDSAVVNVLHTDASREYPIDDKHDFDLDGTPRDVSVSLSSFLASLLPS